MTERGENEGHGLVDERRSQQVGRTSQNKSLQLAYDELRQANDELKRENSRLSQAANEGADLFDLAPVGYATLDERAEVLEANPRLGEMLGVDRRTLFGLCFTELVAKDDQDNFSVAFRKSVAGDGNRLGGIEIRLHRKKGGDLWARIDWVALRDKERLRNIRLTIVDIGEYKRMQASLLQADRLASVGLLAAGISHKINNPLTYVIYNLERLAEELPQLAAALPEQPTGHVAVTGKELVGQAQAALEGAHRIQETATHLGLFSRVDGSGIVPLNVAVVMEDAIDLALNELKCCARVVKDFGETPPVEANKGQLCQVFVNLLINAAHAIEDGDADGNEVRIRIWHENARVLVEVHDTGRGIGAEDLEHIFDPFFTTKDVGSGLGLSICRRIVASYNGTIKVESTLSHGSTIVLSLPALLDPEVTAAPTVETLPGEPDLPCRVLVIDDELIVAEAVEAMLRGHDVTVALSGIEGRRILEGTEHEAFDVVICDLMMPNFSGIDLYAWLKQNQPEMVDRLVFITGAAYTARAQEFLKQVGNVRIQKPFVRADLLSIVQNARRPTPLLRAHSVRSH